MRRPKREAVTLGGSPEDVEQAFYEALAQANLDQWMACWAEDEDIVCVLPNGQRLLGAGAIREAFEQLLTQNGLDIRPQRLHRIEALTSVVHHRVEQVGLHTPQGAQTVWLTSSKVYHQTPQGWRLVLLHATFSPVQAVQDGSQHPQVLH